MASSGGGFDAFDRALIQLRILSKVGVGDKLSLLHGELVLQPASVWQRVHRWWREDDRDRSEQRLRVVAADVGELAQLMMTSLHGVALFVDDTPHGTGVAAASAALSATTSSPVRSLDWHETQLSRLANLEAALVPAAAGVRRLCGSYEGDANMTARLEVCADRLQALAAHIGARLSGVDAARRGGRHRDEPPSSAASAATATRSGTIAAPMTIGAPLVSFPPPPSILQQGDEQKRRDDR